MGEVAPAAVDRAWFEDERDGGRRLRAARHEEQGLVVLSLWRHDVCTGTFQLSEADAARLVEALEPPSHPAGR